MSNVAILSGAMNAVQLIVLAFIGIESRKQKTEREKWLEVRVPPPH